MEGDRTRSIRAGSAVVLALRSSEAAKALGISPRLLATLVAQNRIPHVRINRAVVFPVADLTRWLSEQAAKSNGSSTPVGASQSGGAA